MLSMRSVRSSHVMLALALPLAAGATALALPTIVDVNAGGAINFGGVTNYTFSVSGVGTSLTNLDLRLAIEQVGFVGEHRLTFILTAPDSTSVSVLGTLRVADGSLRIGDAWFSDSSPNAFPLGLPLFLGPEWGGQTYQAFNPLAAFNGINPNGTWTLTITDTIVADSSGFFDFDVTDAGYTGSLNGGLLAAGDAASWTLDGANLGAIGTQLIITAVPTPGGCAVLLFGAFAATKRRRR